MESVEAIRGGLSPGDNSDLAVLYEEEGPCLSCYLNTEAAAEDAPRRIGVRWKDLRRQLTSEGADETSLSAVESALEDARRSGEAICILARGGVVAIREGGERALANDVASVAPLPVAGPLLTWRQHRIPYVVVLCDAAGADILASAGRETITATAGDPDPHDPILHKVPSGGWSQRRYQHRVENAWERNAKDVIETLTKLAAEISPRLVLYGGDPRAVGLLEEHAPESLAPVMERAPLSRAADGSERHAGEEIRRAVETAVAADTASLMAQVRELESRALAVQGAAAVLDALTAAQVETLLVHDDPRDERTACISRHPLVVAAERSGVEQLVETAEEARLVDVALAGAFLTGASVRIVPAHPLEDGIAALLRFPA